MKSLAQRLCYVSLIVSLFAGCPAQAVIVGSASAGVDIHGNPYPADSVAAHTVNNSAVSPFGGIGDIDGGTGALIDSTHVLTAAHLFNNQGPNFTNISFTLNCGGTHTDVIPVLSVAISPEYGGPGEVGDVAVVTLSRPAQADAPIYPLYTAAQLLQGQVLQYVGYGQTGNGDNPGSYTNDDTITKHFGYNHVEGYLQPGVNDTITPNDPSGNQVFAFGFDAPDGSPGPLGYTTLGNQYESNFGNGDSGGPCFVVVNGQYQIAAIAGFNFRSNNDPNNFGTAFGNGGGGTVIRRYAGFIQSVAPNVVISPEPSPLAIFGIGSLLIGVRAVKRRAKTLLLSRVVLRIVD